MDKDITAKWGDVHISQRAISLLAAKAARTVTGVADLEATFAETAALKMGRHKPSYGVEIMIHEQEVEITLRLVICYGCRIPDVALAVQQKVKHEVEQMTAYQVSAVHIDVQGIDFDHPVTSGDGDGERG